MPSLKECPVGTKARILSFKTSGPFKRRLIEMGFLPGRTLYVLRNAPLRDPLEVEILGYHLTIRREEAAYIQVEPLQGGPHED